MDRQQVLSGHNSPATVVLSRASHQHRPPEARRARKRMEIRTPPASTRPDPSRATSASTYVESCYRQPARALPPAPATDLSADGGNTCRIPITATSPPSIPALFSARTSRQTALTVVGFARRADCAPRRPGHRLLHPDCVRTGVIAPVPSITSSGRRGSDASWTARLLIIGLVTNAYRNCTTRRTSAWTAG